MFYRQTEQAVFAVEIGTSKIAVAVGQVQGDGQLGLIGAVEIPSLGIRKGDVIEPKEAGLAVHNAIAEAEEKFDVEIDDIYLAISGAHIEAACTRLSVDVTGQEGQVTHQDVNRVHGLAEETSIPAHHQTVATFPVGYSIDGSEMVPDPVGLQGSKLEGSFLVVHGIESRVRNIMARIHGLGRVTIRDYVITPVASAEAVLSKEQQEAGALVIDLGGGLTHYAAYKKGSLMTLGVLGVGGDHVTQDIVLAFNLPRTEAEHLKCSEGMAFSPLVRRTDTIRMPQKAGFGGATIYTDSLLEVMRVRWSETFSIIKERVDQGGDNMKLMGGGVVLTGGGARTKGIEQLAEKIFQCPVSIGRVSAIEGNVSDLERPELASVLGVMQHGHHQMMREIQQNTLSHRVRRVFEKVITIL